MIAKARIEAGLSPEQLAARMGYRSKSSIYRFESEEQEPTAEQVNALVTILRLSAEDLLSAMGVNLAPPAAAKLPRPLVDVLMQLTPKELESVETVALGQLALRARRGADRQ